MSLKGVVILLIVWLGLVFCALTVRAEIDGVDGVTFSPPDPLMSYGYKEKSNWTGWNKFWFGSSLALFGVGDTASTIYQIKGKDSHCSEGNPALGGDPATGLLIAGKIVAFGLMWLVTEKLEYESDESQQLARNIMYGSTSIVGGAVTVKNMSLDCY